MGLNRLTTALAGLIALVGINAGNAQAAGTQPVNEKTPLVLEHGSVFNVTGTSHAELADHYSHSSHASHESHASHYSSRY